MKRLLLFIFCSFVFFISCDDNENPIDVVFEETERGAVLRTIIVSNGIFDPSDLESGLDVLIEEQDIEEGIIFDGIDVFVEYFDRTPGDGFSGTSEVFLKKIERSIFEAGPNGLPRANITVSLQEIVNLLNLGQSDLRCPDQIGIRLEIILSDGRRFSVNDASASILTEDCFFKSPYYYILPVTQEIDEDTFTGTYFYQTLEDGNSPQTLGESGILNITQGDFPNERKLSFGIDNTPMVITCNTAYLKAFESLNGSCEMTAGNILLGPSTATGGLDIEDDGVFILEFIRGYRGFAGFTGNGEQTVRLRLSRQ